MQDYEISVLIPARNEIFLRNTVEDILKHKEAKTQIIVGLDGKWSNPPIKDHPDVVIVHVSESIGQRAMTNQLARLSKAKYLLKCDAHCSFDQGFDRILLADMQDDWTVVPIMRNLWAFDWKCNKCGRQTYQGPTPTKCEKCDNTTKFERVMYWIGKKSPQSTAYCFDATPHFQYASELKKRPGYENGIIVGYDLSIIPEFLTPALFEKFMALPISGPQPSFITGIISLFANFANSHHFTSSSNSFSKGKNMTMNTAGFSSVDGSRSIGATKIFEVGNELEMRRVATTPILAEVINDRNIPSSSSGDFFNEPSIDKTMNQFSIPEIGQVSISKSIKFPLPIPTSGDIINSDIIKKINDKIGGEFVYNEKVDSFHNGSVALKPIYNKTLTETMSLQGSCFMMTREKYMKFAKDRDELGSWGNEGLEIACRTWLSGGKCMVNHKTWYAHMFRTQGLDFGFPYPQPGREVAKTKDRVKELIWNMKLPDQIYPVSWLVKRFTPSIWSKEDLDKLLAFESSLPSTKAESLSKSL